MKICDRCDKPTVGLFTVNIVEDDATFHLCMKHKSELARLICTKETKGKKGLFGGKKDSAKAG